MGFRIDENTIKSSLNIKKENLIKGFSLIKEIFLEQDNSCRVNETDIKNTTNFEELIIAINWELKLDDLGNVESIYNHGLNVSEEKLLFTSIAKFVEDGSYVEYEREAYGSKQKERFEYQDGKVNHRVWIEDYDQNGDYFWNEMK